MPLVRTVTCRFYGGLNLFLLACRRNRRFFYAVKGVPAIKDTLEALGVPHTEIDAIIVDGRSVPFSHQIQGGEKIEVYPDAGDVPAAKIIRLKPRTPAHPQFILDVHLGRLARHLRLLGFDAMYKNDAADEDIVRILRRGKRILLTRDIGLLKNRSVRYGCFVRAVDPMKQIREIVRRFTLAGKIKPFRLCLECNGKIRRVAKSRIVDRLPPLTRQYYRRFYLCCGCDKIYWQGAHYQRLMRIVRLAARLNVSKRD